MRSREEILDRVKGIVDGEYPQDMIPYLAEVLLDIRDLLQKSEDRMVRMETDIASRLQQ